MLLTQYELCVRQDDGGILEVVILAVPLFECWFGIYQHAFSQLPKFCNSVSLTLLQEKARGSDIKDIRQLRVEISWQLHINAVWFGERVKRVLKWSDAH